MPQPGQKTVTIPEKIYKKAKDAAEAEGKPVARFVTDLILDAVQEVPANG